MYCLLPIENISPLESYDYCTITPIPARSAEQWPMHGARQCLHLYTPENISRYLKATGWQPVSCAQDNTSHTLTRGATSEALSLFYRLIAKSLFLEETSDNTHRSEKEGVSNVYLFFLAGWVSKFLFKIESSFESLCCLWFENCADTVGWRNAASEYNKQSAMRG